MRWSKVRRSPLITEGMFDSQNIAFWSESERQYGCHLRRQTGEGDSGIRTVSRATSKDFRESARPQRMAFRDREL